MENMIEMMNAELMSSELLLKEYRIRMRKLAPYRGCYLVPVARNRKYYYYLSHKGKKGRRYLGRESNRTVAKVQTLRLLTAASEILEGNIKAIRQFQKKYVEFDTAAVHRLLPKTYISPEDSRRLMLRTSPEAAKWKAKMESIKAAYAPPYPEMNRHRCRNGELMKSKSEVIIANLLDSLGVTYIYEMPFYSGGRVIYPDFTIYTANETIELLHGSNDLHSASGQRSRFIDPREDAAMELNEFGGIILEHLGLLSDDAYRRRNFGKLDQLFESGFTLWKNLIISSEDACGNIDEAAIHRMLESCLRAN